MGAVLRVPVTMRRLWYAQIVSVFGDFLALFAVITVMTFQLHATPAADHRHQHRLPAPHRRSSASSPASSSTAGPSSSPSSAATTSAPASVCCSSSYTASTVSTPSWRRSASSPASSTRHKEWRCALPSRCMACARPDRALNGDSRKRLTSDQRTDLTGMPVANRCIEDRHEWTQAGLNAGVAKIKGVESAKAPRLFI